MAGLESWGVPYLAPYTPYEPTGRGDAILRRDISFQRTRPPFLKPQDKYRLPKDGDEKETANETKS